MDCKASPLEKKRSKGARDGRGETAKGEMWGREGRSERKEQVKRAGRGQLKKKKMGQEWKGGNGKGEAGNGR